MLKALTTAQEKLLAKYNLVLAKDVANEDERKALKKARRQRRKLRLARKAALAAAKPEADKAPAKAAAKAPAKSAAKPKASRKVKRAARPSDKHVDALKAAGGTVTKVPAGARTLSRDELKAAVTGETVENVRAVREARSAANA